MANKTPRSTYRSLRVPQTLDDQISSLVAQTGRSRTEIMVARLEGASVDWGAYEQAVLRAARALPTRAALREARRELGL